jgi:hypothetical protein
MSITDQVMARCALLRSTSGRSCILSNHGLDQSATTSRTAPVYREIDALYTRSHDPVDLQTITPNGFGGCQAIALAVRHHAVAVELWPPSPRFRGYAAFSKRTLVSWAHALRRHHLRGC